MKQLNVNVYDYVFEWIKNNNIDVNEVLEECMDKFEKEVQNDN